MSVPLWLRECTSLSTADCISPTEAVTLKLSHQAWDKQSCLTGEDMNCNTEVEGSQAVLLVQSRVSCNTWATSLQVHLTVVLFHSHDISQLSYLHWIEFLPSLHPKSEAHFGIKLSATIFSWQQKTVHFQVSNINFHHYFCIPSYKGTIFSLLKKDSTIGA